MAAMRLAVVSLLASACGRIGFDEPFTPSHLGERPPPATAALELGDALIDTTALTIDGVVPIDASFVPALQSNGPEVAVLVVDSLVVTGTVRVVGGRPLVIVGTTIDVDGVIDGGARSVVPGPGGGAAGVGIGAGGSTSKPFVEVCDPGGGGGGFGQLGASGGLESCASTQGAGGPVYGDGGLGTLVAGSGGGLASGGACPRSTGGAGGGAIQLTAYGVLTITGAITVGGGGGEGGPYCEDNDAGAGAGGGAGGAIFLEARAVDRRGMLAANGGGGGAGGNGSTENGAVGDGEAGGDGRLDGMGSGGESGATTSGDGGAGGSQSAPPTPGEAADFNPGGGGGGAGRIVVRVR